MRTKQEDRDYNVALEINICAPSPIEAARKLQEWMRDTEIDWHFFVQDDLTNKIYSVDLSEEDDDIVIEADGYIPVIRNVQRK